MLLAQSPAPPTVSVPPASPHAAASVNYVDVTAAAGLAGFRHVSGSPEKTYVIETTGSGVAMADFDGDGLVDIYLVNGSTIDRVLSGSPAPKAAFYRNTGNGTFRDITDAAGVANERWGQGVCVGDFDNDGRGRLLCRQLRTEPPVPRPPATARFVDVAAKAGVAVNSWSTGCAFGDYDGDGWLDLYVAGYVDFDVKNPPPAPGAAIRKPQSASGAASSEAKPRLHKDRSGRCRAAGTGWARRIRRARPCAPTVGSRSCAARAG